MKDARIPIPQSVKRQLLIEAGFKCSIPNCPIQVPTIHFHHIDENPSNNDISNILILCPTHHQMVTSGSIDKTSCELLKEMQTRFLQFAITEHSEYRNKLLYSLCIELYINLNILNDDKFKEVNLDSLIFPRFIDVVLCQAIASGEFIKNIDNHLYKLVFGWMETLKDFNHRLDLMEYRTIVVQASTEEINYWHMKLLTGVVLANVKSKLIELTSYLYDNYSDETGITKETVLFSE
jgi:hypothetical protein